VGAKSKRARPYAVPVWLAATLFATAGAAILLAATVLSSGDVRWMHAMNATLPALVGATCLGASYLMVHRQPAALWTPLPWFLAAWAVYYGFGPLVYVYGTPESVAYMDSLYAVDEGTLLQTNVLNLVGLLAVLGGAVFVAQIRFRRTERRQIALPHDPWRVAWLFLAIGVPVKYLLELPYVLGLVDFVLPGSIQYLGMFSGLAILPLSVAVREQHRWAKPVLWILVLAEIAVGIVMLAKLHIIKTTLLVFLGRYAVRPDLRSLIATGVVVAVAYVAILSPFVNYARLMLGRASAQDVTEAVGAAQAFGTEGREALADVLPGVQSWWTRLAYPNAQAFAMAEFDQGRPGSTFAMAAYALVPRFLYEDKPIMTPGKEYTQLIQGTDTSSTGLGVFGEAYWNGGWPLVMVTGLYIGSLFGLLGRMAIHAISSHQWLFVPLIFQAIYLGLRPDDWFVPAYFSGVIQTLIIVVLLNILGRPLMIRTPKRT